ncbi:MAG TPA: sialidase family protein, partial [Thermoanaerobaculia bacterium]
GATWTFDATFSGTQTDTDKQIIWVDHSATSPFKDNLYAIWHNGDPAFMNRRTGPAGSWQTPVQVSGEETSGTAIGDDVKTNAFGDVFGFWPDTGNSKVFAVKSTNGGASFGMPVQVATTFDSYDIGVPSMARRRALIYISGGAYRTAAKNLVYASWTDLTGATGCASPANEPGTNVSATCKTRIWFARSTDGGATWGAPVMINNQASLNDQFNQWMVVDETTGALGIMYYDSIGGTSRKKVDVWYQSSYDDGVTWTLAVKVTSAQTDETVSGSDTGNQFGDYNSLSGIAGQFFPTWTDRRSNGREEIWTAKLTDTPCTLPGVPAIGTATANGQNQIQITWGNGAPAAAAFNVYRAAGTCAAPGAFNQIAATVAASPYADGTVAGALTYAYQVTGLDAGGLCESVPSGCVQATTPGNLVFTDGFESGDLGAWSGATP